MVGLSINDLPPEVVKKLLGETRSQTTEEISKSSEDDEESRGHGKTKQTTLGKGDLEQVVQIKKRTGSGVMREYLGEDDPSYVRSENERLELKSEMSEFEATRSGLEETLAGLSAQERHFKGTKKGKEISEKKKVLSSALKDLKRREKEIINKYNSGYTLAGGLGELIGTAWEETKRDIRELPYDLAEDIRTSNAYRKQVKQGKKYQKLSRAFERGQQTERAEYEREATATGNRFDRSEKRKDIIVDTEKAFSTAKARTEGVLKAKELEAVRIAQIQAQKPKVYRDWDGKIIPYDPDPMNMYGTKTFGGGATGSGSDIGYSKEGMRRANALLGYVEPQPALPEERARQEVLKQTTYVSERMKPRPEFSTSPVVASSGMRKFSNDEVNNWLTTGNPFKAPRVQMEERSVPKKLKEKSRQTSNPVVTRSPSMLELDLRGYNSGGLFNINVPAPKPNPKPSKKQPKSKASKKHGKPKEKTVPDITKQVFPWV